MKKLLLFSFIMLLIAASCSNNSHNSSEVMLKNQSDFNLTDQYVEIDLDKLGITEKSDNMKFFVMVDGIEVPSQKIGEKKIGLITDFKAKEEKTAIIEFGQNVKTKKYKDRAYTELAMKVGANEKDGYYSGGKFETFDSLRIPDGHIDHNALFKYEGLGLESDKVAYRMYIDWRNRIDIFGKKTNDIVLPRVGRDDLESENESYHEMNDWGMDIFKVGNTLGIGTYGMYTDDGFVSVETRDSVIVQIIENGPLKATAMIDYYGWKVNDKIYDLNAKLSSFAGSRLIEVDLDVTNNPKSLITGLAKHENTELTKSDIANGWNYIGLYGMQTLNDDDLGIALFYNTNSLVEQTEDDGNYIVELKPNNGKVKYYFAAAWEKEPNGIKSKSEFDKYLNNVVELLNNPIILEY